MKSSLSWKLAAVGLLFLLPLALRIFPIRHGMPRNYVPDTHMVRQALGMARDHDLVPQAGKYSFYPNLLPYLLLPCYAAEYAAGKAEGSWRNAKEFGDHLLDHPEDAELVARFLVAVFGALTPLVVYKTARAAGFGRGAWVSAWLAGTALLSVQLSVQERPWAPMTFFMVLACWPAALYARDGGTARLLSSGAAAALSAACHQGGLLALAIPGLAWLLGPVGWRGADLPRRLGQGCACVAVFLALALALGYPHFLRYGFHAAKVAGGAQEVAKQGGIHVGGLSIVFEVRWSSAARLAGAIVGYDAAIVFLGLGGLALGLARRELRAALVFALLWAAFFMTNRSDHVRYLLPALLFLCWPAGLLAERLLGSGGGRALLGALLALPLVQSARLDWVLSRPDTRAEAESRLAALQKGAVVAIDRYGPEVDLDRASLVRLARLRGTVKDVLRAREERRLRRFEEGAIAREEEGIDAVRLEELFEVVDRTGAVDVRQGLEALGTSPKEVLAAVGATHFLLVDRRPGGDPTNSLQALARGGRLLWAVDPARRGPPSEAFLPTEMDFALTALWEVSRPGPWMALYELRSQ